MGVILCNFMQKSVWVRTAYGLRPHTFLTVRRPAIAPRNWRWRFAAAKVAAPMCWRHFITSTLAASNGKRTVTVWRPSVRLLVCLFQQHTHRHSPGGSMRRGKSTFRPDNEEKRHSLVQYITILSMLWKAWATRVHQSFNLSIMLTTSPVRTRGMRRTNVIVYLLFCCRGS